MAAAKHLDPKVRLPRLESAKQRAPKKRGAMLSAVPMAELLGVSWVTLRDWCDTLQGFDDSGCFTRGARGTEWQFRAVKTINWLTRYFEKVLADQESRSRGTARALGMAEDAVPTGFSLAEVDRSLAIVGKVQAEKIAQAKWVSADQVREILRNLMVMSRDHILGVAQVSDPNGVFPPEIREKVERASFEQAAAYAEAVEAIVNKHESSLAR